MTERFSALDEVFLQIEAPHRATHWTVVLDLIDDPGTAGRSASAPITETALRTRVAERIGRYPMFRLGPDDHCPASPIMREYDRDTTLSCVSSAEVSDDQHYRETLSALLAQPLTRDRPAWRAVLINQRQPRLQRLAVLGHHSMSDGFAAAGYAALFIDGDDEQLQQLDRYLIPDRYTRPSVTARQFLSGAKALAASWAHGARSRRLPRLTRASRRATCTVELPTREVRAIAGELGCGTGELLVAAIGAAVADVIETLLKPAARPARLRTFLPANLDDDFRHRGNAASIVLIDLPGTSMEFTERVANIGRDLTAAFDSNARLALPTASHLTRWMPRRVRYLAARAALFTLAPDVNVGVSPGYLNLRPILGRPIGAILPLSPLLGNPLSCMCLILGRTVHLGIVWDPNALGDRFGVSAAQRITELVDPGGVSTFSDAR